MAITLESVQRLTALKNKIDGVTNIASGTLAEAIDNTLAGYGQGGGDTTNEDALVTGTLTNYKNDRVTSIRSYGFYNNTSITSVVFSKTTNIGSNTFMGCKKLTSVDFPSVKNIGTYAFQNCTALTSVNIPLLENMDTYVFQSCSSLKSVGFPLATHIGNYSFQRCTKLTSVNIPLVTSVASGLFNNCSALTSIDLPSVTNINSTAFSGCSILASVILRSDTVCQLVYTNAFTNTPIAKGTGHIYVPSILIDTYKTTGAWSNYADQFRALEDYTVDGTTTGELDESKVNGGTA